MYQRVGILLVEVYERVAKSVIWVCKRARKDGQMNFMAVKESSFVINHNYNKIVKSDWLLTALISDLIGQFNRIVRVMP